MQLGQLDISSLSLGSPLTSPSQRRMGMRTSIVRRWGFWLLAVGAFLFIVQSFLGDKTQYLQPHAVAHKQNSNGNKPLQEAYGHDFPQTRNSDVAVRSDFPPKIWQTWKVDPLHFEERDINTARSWPDKNPDWRYEVLTDGNDQKYVEYHYGPEGFNRPDIVKFYRDLDAAIIKADLLRYLIMYAEGGVYADIDVEAMKPMSKFIPERYDHKDINMVIGIEIDEPEWKDHPILGPKSRSFCQWTFMCKPRLPVMMRLVENIMTWLYEVAEKQDVPLGKVILDFDEVISGTGPSAFTKAIIAQMNADRAASAEDGKPAPPELTWDTFHDLDESKLVDHVLVLNVEAFAAGQGHSDSGTHDTRHSLVRHHYHASNWPSRHPRYQHPAYGQVEDCNWSRDCVHEWDDNVARYPTLPLEDQQRLVAERDQRIADELRAEEQRIQEEKDNRVREDEEKRREEAEKFRAEDEEKRLAAERVAVEALQAPQPPEGSWWNNGFGYFAFCVWIAGLLWINRRRLPLSPSSSPSLLPRHMADMEKA